MNLTKLGKINEAADAYADAKMALDRLPTDEVVLAHLEKNPEDLRLGVRTPPPEEEIAKAIAENPGVAEEFVRAQFLSHFSVDISPADQQKMLDLMRALLQERVERLAANLRELGIEPESAEAAALEAESANGQRIH